MNKIKNDIKDFMWSVLYTLKKSILKKKNQHRLKNFDLDRLPNSFIKLKGPVYYIIYVKDKGHGFFSNFFHVLFHMSIAEFYNWIPVVDMENHQTLYNEKKIINSTYNSWEYYFKQNVSISDINFKKDKVIFCDGNFPYKIFYELYYENEEYFFNLFKKYIFFKEEIINHVNSFKKQFFENNPIIGVHWRGTDRVVAMYRPKGSFLYKSRKILSINELAQIIDPLILKNKNSKIFLSTDEVDYIKQFKELYGSRVVFTDSYRTTSDKGLHLEEIYPRENHFYKLGLEVLIDSLLLSECDYLICNKSNVSNAAILFNLKKNRKIIDLRY